MLDAFVNQLIAMQITTLQSEKLKLAADLASTNEQLLTTTYALSSANKKVCAFIRELSMVKKEPKLFLPF